MVDWGTVINTPVVAGVIGAIFGSISTAAWSRYHSRKQMRDQ
jgi:hypothetical protein